MDEIRVPHPVVETPSRHPPGIPRGGRFVLRLFSVDQQADLEKLPDCRGRMLVDRLSSLYRQDDVRDRRANHPAFFDERARHDDLWPGYLHDQRIHDTDGLW